MEDLKELSRIAEAATPGPWEKYDLPVAVANSNFTIHAPNAVGVPTWTTALPPEIASTLKAEDAEFVATFDPPTVLALLSRLEQAEQAVARVSEYHRREEVRDVFGDHQVRCAGCFEWWPCTTARALDGDR
ncbi:ead/Ea22-like family protein [Arthrobacter sp. YC-RL1]|uniref:ead/Ea22-like family protein n=1 Tax=Arthrobacter sp. YC-RL1 TaxID=1652545 RepID=UPI0009E2FB49|nr:ead/Ea22-like family protein [Arthrobacter sp. YC-RL1]